MRYEVKSFAKAPDFMPNRDQRPPEEQATEWLNEVAQNNGRFVDMAVLPGTNGHSIIVIVSFD
jgi:hypothetical protein